VLRLLRVARVLRVLKLGQLSDALSIFMRGLLRSKDYLLTLGMVLCLVITLPASGSLINCTAAPMFL
jgi:hypothetical protein